ncbi:hypothetical protein LJC46_06720, partial [Desulfovibrio sp. OttesenSCG-928-G15]|nr:hypothetical protein [Desulfovibrio sp. OttesenSCG-928-G15]
MYRSKPVPGVSLCFVGLGLLCLAFLLTSAEAFAQETKIKIFVTTDVHGYVERDPQLGNIGFAA